MLLEVVVGLHTEDPAMDLVEGAAKRLTGGCWPLWSSAGRATYVTALTVVFGVLIISSEPNVPDGRNNRKMCLIRERHYEQVVKERQGRRLVAVTRQVIFGVEE